MGLSLFPLPVECLLSTGVDTGVVRDDEGVDMCPGVGSLEDTSWSKLLEGPGSGGSVGLRRED